MLPLVLLAARPADAPRSQVLTLISPNEEAGGQFGHSVAGAGDVDQDGFADVIVGTYRESDLAGRAYVFSGRDASLVHELVSPNEVSFGRFGYSVAGAGDINRDGSADVIVGAIGDGDSGQAYVFSGQDGTVLFELVSPNAELGGEFGRSVAGAGDVDRDGFPDVIVGAHFESPGTSPDLDGRAYVFSGEDGSLLLQLMSPADDLEGGQFGGAVAGAGDVNQDGSADVIVGGIWEAPVGLPRFAGATYVFSGLDATLVHELVSPNAEFLGLFGYSVAGAGDLNRDGVSDVIVGTPSEEPGTSPDNAGRAYAFSGLDGSLLFELVSPNETDGGQFGTSVSVPGDIDEDGFADVLVGAPEEANTGASWGTEAAGRAYVFSGQNGTLLSAFASPNVERFGRLGFSVSGAGDVDRDGWPDIIAGAYAEDPGTSPVGAGRAYVFLSPLRFRAVN